MPLVPLGLAVGADVFAVGEAKNAVSEIGSMLFTIQCCPSYRGYS